MWLPDISIRRPVSTLTIMGALLVFGSLAFVRMGLDLYPEVDFPFVTVTTTLVGASPEVMDQDVTDVLEEQIKTISGIKSLMSQSFEGLSQVAIEFELDKDVDVAAAEVRAKVNLAKRDLPKDVDEPIVDKLDIAAQAIMWIAVTSRGDYGELAHYADKVVKEQLQSVTGVGNIQPGGMREREVRIWLDPGKLRARDLTAMDVVSAIRRKHVELPGGRVETDTVEYSVKVKGEFASVEAMKNLVVANRNGTVVTLKDVARIDDGAEDNRSIARFNGVPTIGLGVRKQSGTNTVAVADAVKDRLEEIRQSTPQGLSIEMAYDSSEFIKESMRGVQIDIGFGVLLTIIIMYVFLRNVRITLISVITIPLALIGAFVATNALGFTVNNMTMLALSLAVGLVIDDAIVVLENIFRHMEEGEGRMEAAQKGASEVGFAVIAASSSIVAVFLPVAFMKGIIGRFFFQFGLTVALTVLLSVFIGLTLTPMLCSRLLRHQASHRRLYVMLESFFQWLENRYRDTLAWAVGHRRTVIALATLVFIGGLALVPMIGTEFITEADESRFLVRFELPTGTAIEETNTRLREMERILFAQPEVASAFVAVGVVTVGQVNNGMLMVNLLPKDQRKASQQEIMRRMRGLFGGLGDDMLISVENLSPIGGGRRSADVQYVIQGPTMADLEQITNRVVADLRAQDGFVDVDSDLRMSKPDIKVRINRNLANDLGVDVHSISNEVYAMFGGLDVAKFKEGGYRYDIRVRALPEFRAAPEDLERISVRAADGRLIQASNLITYRVGRGPNSVNRFDRRRAVQLFVNLEDVPGGEGLQIVEEVVAQHMPDTADWGTALTGRTRAFRESFQYMFSALLIAILVIYMVLAIQFESFIHPFTIMMSLPLTLVGVFGALLISGKTLNIFSFIGIIMLMGLVTKNAILLVDFANQFRRKGLDKVAAVLRAGPLRLRPILMTAFSTVFGVVPVALALSEGGETRAPMAVAVIGGMITSTVLTLVVIPVVYLILDDLSERFMGGMRSARGTSQSASAPQETHSEK